MSLMNRISRLLCAVFIANVCISIEAAPIVAHGGAPCTTLNMTVCSVECHSDCKTYLTAFDCYSPAKLFPRDPQWGTTDVKDVFINEKLFHRYFYSSSDGSCIRQTDVYELPFDECVGPFGPPRPWGEFKCAAAADFLEIEGESKPVDVI